MPGDYVHYDVFLSYRHEESAALAHIIYEFLVSAGFRVFQDVRDLPAGEFPSVLRESIESSQCFILLVSKSTFDRCSDPKDWIRIELEIALESGRTIIPVRDGSANWPECVRVDALMGLTDFNSVRWNAEYHLASLDKLLRLLPKPKIPVSNMTSVTRYWLIGISVVFVMIASIAQWLHPGSIARMDVPEVVMRPIDNLSSMRSSLKKEERIHKDTVDVLASIDEHEQLQGEREQLIVERYEVRMSGELDENLRRKRELSKVLRLMLIEIQLKEFGRVKLLAVEAEALKRKLALPQDAR